MLSIISTKSTENETAQIVSCWILSCWSEHEFSSGTSRQMPSHRNCMKNKSYHSNESGVKRNSKNNFSVGGDKCQISYWFIISSSTYFNLLKLRFQLKTFLSHFTSHIFIKMISLKLTLFMNKIKLNYKLLPANSILCQFIAAQKPVSFCLKSKRC